MCKLFLPAAFKNEFLKKLQYGFTLLPICLTLLVLFRYCFVFLCNKIRVVGFYTAVGSVPSSPSLSVHLLLTSLPGFFYFLWSLNLSQNTCSRLVWKGLISFKHSNRSCLLRRDFKHRDWRPYIFTQGHVHQHGLSIWLLCWCFEDVFLICIFPSGLVFIFCNLSCLLSIWCL